MHYNVQIRIKKMEIELDTAQNTTDIVIIMGAVFWENPNPDFTFFW